MNERRRGTRRRLAARAWGWWLARIVFLGLILFASLYLLQTVALLAELAPVYGSSAIKIGPVKPVPVGETLTLAGRAPAGSVLEIGTDIRVLAHHVVDPWGRFQVGFPRPPRAFLIRIRALDRKDGRQRGQRVLVLPAPPPRSFPPPTVDLASPLAGRLWLAGQGPPGELLRIESDQGVLGEAWVDALGIYDVVLNVAALPRKVRTVSRWRASPAVAVSATPLPLARTADFLWTATELQTTLQIVLPATHPYFLALSEGSLPLHLFVEKTVGGVGLSRGVQPTLSMAGGRAAIRLVDRLALTSEPWTGIFAIRGSGINGTPLLTGNDRVTVDFGAQAPWIFPLMPTEIVDGKATWRGPVATPASGVIVTLGSDPRSAARPQGNYRPEKPAREEAQPQEENLRELVQHLEGRPGAHLLRQAWRTLIVLIPFLLLLFLATRAGFGRPEAWKTLAAAAAVLAVWRSWELLLACLGAGPDAWLSSLLKTAVWRFDVVGSEQMEPWVESFWDIHANVFWLLFVTLVAISPLYFDDAVRAGLDWRPRFAPERRALWRRALGGGAAGLRVALCAAGLLAARARWAVEGVTPLDPALTAVVEEVPWWLVLAFAGVAALPLVAALLGALVPFTREQGRVRWIAAAALVALALLMPRLPATWLLACAGAALVAGLGWVVVQGLPRTGPLQRLGAWADRAPAAFLGTCFAAGLALAWPFGPRRPGLVELGSFAGELGQVFPYVLALGVVLLLLDHVREREDVLLPPEILAAGGYLFAAFVINSALTWLFVPVAFLAGLFLAAVWLFRPRSETDRLAAALPEGRRHPRLLIQSVIESTELGSRFLRIRKSLAEKLEGMDLKPQEYEERLAEYRAYLESKAHREDLPEDLEPRALVFAVGEPTIRDNTMTALRWGTILSLGPLLVALYQYLPASGVRHPFPIMDLFTFLIGALASWLLYAFFFGYFFVHLRGDSGLTKGAHLFSLVAIPFAIYHLLHAPTLVQVRPFLLWTVQVFLFFTLLGLLAFDYGLLRRNGFRFKDLRLVHDMPALSAYASTVIATVVPAVAALVTGELKDLVSFFLETILPGGPS